MASNPQPSETGLLRGARRRLASLLPSHVRRWIWYVTDPEYRTKFRAETARIARFRAAHRESWPAIWKQTGGVIASGPFAGMKYLEQPGLFNHKLLGTYESELTDVIDEIRREEYRTIIDIGAAEGYYACGLAFLNENARVIGFESQKAHHQDIARMARLNGLESRVKILETCTLELLNRELSGAGPRLIVCDVDGAEVDLLKPDQLPGLLAADLLVEVHDAIRPGASQCITERFAASHHVRFIPQRPKGLDDLPANIRLEPDLALASMDEFRGSGNDWLWMKHRAAG